MPKKTTLTPIRRQYLRIKKQYPDAILFFRLGDFYETFDQDAHIVSRELDVVLTSRNVAKGQRVPMAGVPHHAADGYIARLISKGYRVAICEQLSDQPEKGLIPRDVVRVITPGTVIEPTLLAEKRNNYLVALARADDRVGLAYVDITTGEFATTEFRDPGGDLIIRELDRLQPAEIILSDGGEPFLGHGQEETAEAQRRFPQLAVLDTALSLYDDWRFELGNCERALLEHFAVATLAGFGCADLDLAICAAGVLVQYLKEHQPSALKQLVSLSTYSIDDFMILDMATRRNLELVETLRSRSFRGSLLWVLDETLTPMGGRLLRRWVNQPLLDIRALEERLTAVQVCVANPVGRATVRQELVHFGDLERLANRLIQGAARPRDLIALRNALEKVSRIREGIGRLVGETTLAKDTVVSPLNIDALDSCPDLVALISRAIVDDPPATLAEGGVIRSGYSAELDAIQESAAAAKQWVAQLEAVERERTGIKNLKVGFNKVFGYYLEVTKANVARVPDDYIRKQTLVNAERYITPELKEKEALILNAAERRVALEQALFRELVEQLAQEAMRILETARAIAHLDVYLSLAEVAARYQYVRPELADDGRIDIVGGRHPVVERTLTAEPFVPNDVHLSPEETIHIVTGPNMSGKSTFLRQTALIVLMAQIGSFVPAESAHIGLVDRIFARVGAQDEIASGQSTFMVEMVELANILHHATDRSLLILDEIGRGTSTYDGISIAWALVEYLHNTPGLCPKTLFATHYHELTELENLLPRVGNYNVAVRHRGEQVVFTHHIVPGGADRSYGIHVAQMAGLPRELVERAQEILRDLERAAERVPVSSGPAIIKVQQLSLFSDHHPVLQELREIDVTRLSPIEALNKLYELQQKAQ